MKFAYYPGCSSLTTSKDFEMSTRELSKYLGFELHQIPDWTCCGSSPAHHRSEILAIALPVLNLMKAEEMGYPLLTTCPSCFSLMKKAEIKMEEDAKLRGEVEKITNVEYMGGVVIKHLLEVLSDDEIMSRIVDGVVVPLDGLKVASYYGCLLARPRSVNIFEEDENPLMMDNLIDEIGGESLDWSHKTECCGANFTITKPDIVEKLTYRILNSAVESGADCISVACPFCQMNLDLRQRDINKTHNEEFDIPIFYITQLIGLAMGISEKRLGISKLMVDPASAISKVRGG